MTRYFADASTLTLILRSENSNVIIGKASVLIGDSLGHGQTSLVGIAHIEEDSIIKGSLVYVLRLRTGRESWLLSERSLLESRIPPGEISSFMNTEDYLELLKKRINEINGGGNVQIADRELSSDPESRVNMKAEEKSVLDLDITYPLATYTSHIGTEVKNVFSTALEKRSTSPQRQSNVEANTNQAIPNQDPIIPPVSSLPNFQSLNMDSNRIPSSKLLHTSFEVAEDIASGDVHNLLSTPSSLFQKRTTAEEREEKARDSGGLIGRASRGTSPVTSSSSNLRGTSPSGRLLQNLNKVSSPNSSIGIVSFVSHKNGTQQDFKLTSPFAATAPRPDGASDVMRASEKHTVLNGKDLWSAECLSTATLSQREEHDSFVSSQHINDIYHSEDDPLTIPKPVSGQDSCTKVTEDPSLWLAGISQPGFSRKPKEHSHENVTANKTTNSSLTQLLSRSSASLKGIDEALVIGENLGGSGSLHSRATINAAETSLRAKSKDIVASKNAHSDLPISIPSKIAKNLSQSEAIIAAYQDITSSLNKGGSSATTAGNLFENKTLFNSDILSLLEGTDERTMAIINDTASSSMGEIAASDDPVEDRNRHSSQRVNDPLSYVLQEANVDYFRLKSALYAAESALRIPSLNRLGDRLRSLSQRVNGINVDVSAAILFPAATVLSSYQSSGKFGSIALLAVEDEQRFVKKGKSDSHQHPRIVKQQSAQALKDWLKGCKMWLEYSIPPCATSKAVQDSQSNSEACDDVTEPGKAITARIMAHPVGLSENSHSLNIASNDGDNIKSGEKVILSKKSTSPTKPLAMTSSSPRKSFAPPSGSPLQLVNPSRSGGDSTLLPPAQKNNVTSTLSTNAAHLLLSSIPHPSLSIPSGYVSDWDQQHSVMTLDSLAHTRENKIRFDDDCLSRWLGNSDEEELHEEQSSLASNSLSSIVVKLYLDASPREQSLAPASKLSSSKSAQSSKKPGSPPKGETDYSTPLFASNSSASSSNSNHVLIGEGRIPLRQVLLSDSLSLDANVDIFNVHYTADKRPHVQRVSSSKKTLAILNQIREKSSNTAIASFGSPVRDSTDVIKSRHETFLSSLSLSSDEKQRVQRALAVRTAAVENNPDETKRVVGEALSPIQRESLGGYLMTDSKILRSDTMISSTPITSEVVARVRMRVFLLQNTLQRIEAENKTSSNTVVETLRSVPNEASEMKKSQSNLSEGYASLPRPFTFHSNLPPSSLHCVLGADWETLRLPASSFILQSTSDGGRDINQKSQTSSPQSTSLFSNKASKLPHILLGDGNNRDDSIDADEERGLSGGGASLILSLHKTMSISPRGAFTALGGSSVADDHPHSNSSIVSLFVRAQPNRAVISMPIDKPHINVPSTRQCVCTSPTSLPEFRLNSDVILPLHKPSSTDDAEDLAKTLLSSKHSGCVLEVYGSIASSDESNESYINSSTTSIKPRLRLISQEPILLGTVKVPLEDVADALTHAARSETSLWDGPERVFRYPKVFDIIHPASADGSSCGQLSLTVYVAAHGRQLLVFTGQSASALEIQKWWSIVVVKARKNRLERERIKREEEEMEQLKSAEDERVKTGKGKGKKVQQQVPVNARNFTSAEKSMLTTKTKAPHAGLSTTSRADNHEEQFSNHFKFRSSELSQTQTELSSRTAETEFLSSELIPPAILSELVPPNKSSELISPTESSKLQSSTINHTQKTLPQDANPWVIETCISDQMNVISSQNGNQETQAAISLVDVESALVVDELVTDFFPVDQNSVDANHAFESGDEENVDTSVYFQTHSTEPEIRSSTSNMQDDYHESFKDISVDEVQVSVTASDDIFIYDIATSPTIAMNSGLSCTSNVIHSVDDESKKTKDQVYDIITTIDAEASNGLNLIDSRDRDCEHFLNKTLEPERLSFISEVPRLRIDSLQINLSKTERMSAALPSSSFGSHHAPKIHLDEAKKYADDLLAQLAHELIHKEETVIEEKVKSNETSDIKELASLPMNTDKSSESELVNIDDCAKTLTTTIVTVSTSTMNDCCNINSSDDGMEHPTESYRRLNSTLSETESQNELNSELQLLSIVYQPQSHPTVDIDKHRDDVHDIVDNLDLQSDADMYSLDFESETHAEDACWNDEKEVEDGHSKFQSDSDDDEKNEENDGMDYDNSRIDGGEVIHYSEDDDNANIIPGYVISTDEETLTKDASDEEPTIAHEQLMKNICVINQSKRFSNGHNEGGRNEDDHSNFDEHLDIEDDGKDNQRKHSYLMAKKSHFQYRRSEHLENVEVDEDDQEKNSDVLQSQSGSPTSLLDLLSRQDELFFKAAYNDDINHVYDDVIYENESSVGGALLAVNKVHPVDTRNVGNYVSSTLDQFSPSLTIERCNSITLSEIEEALAVGETSRAQSNNDFVVYKDVDMEQLIVQNPQETVSQLLGSTFEEEIISAVAFESGSALEKCNSEDVNSVGSQTIRISRSSSSSLSSHISNDVAVWKDVVAVINQWVENQRDSLISNSNDSIEKYNERYSPQTPDFVEHVKKINQSISAITTDGRNTQLTVTLHVNDRDSYSPERTFERPQIGKRSHLTNSDRIVQQGLLHISENVPAATDNHARLREMPGLVSSSTLSSSHSDLKNKVTASQSQSSNRDIDVEKKRTPTRLIDVRDTNKLAELLRGIKSL